MCRYNPKIDLVFRKLFGKWYDIEMQLAEQGAYGKRSFGIHC
ncbi:hypothetical protein [Halobacteroides halobius]|nr:hypothetical protein [Halobacteroides halobius]